MGSYQGLRQQTCREFIAQNCKASVLRVFPGQLLDVLVETFWKLQEQEIERLRQRENCYSIPGFVSSGLGGKAGDPTWHLRYLRR
jgi:hypothetical protein